MALINAQLEVLHTVDVRSIPFVLINSHHLKMLQAQQRVGVRGSPHTSPGAGSVAVGSRTSDGLMSQSTANRKALLGQSYYEDAKK